MAVFHYSEIKGHQVPMQWSLAKDQMYLQLLQEK
uniref:Uncharacterized protein n=1 Tax=Rhizophora mucronata TaxID=61149 RepID=A0A2P2QK92_RHIMU